MSYEDKDEAIKLIFGELILHPQNARQIFNTSRFANYLMMMTN